VPELYEYYKTIGLTRTLAVDAGSPDPVEGECCGGPGVCCDWHCCPAGSLCCGSTCVNDPTVTCCVGDNFCLAGGFCCSAPLAGFAGCGHSGSCDVTTGE